MKYVSKLAFAGLMVANCSTYAVTPADGWYFGLMGGISKTQSLSITGPDPTEYILISQAINPVRGLTFLDPNNLRTLPITDTRFRQLLYFPFLKATLNHSIGGDFGAQLGYRLCNFRFEGELLLNTAPISNLRIGGVTIGNHVTPINPFRINGNSFLAGGLFNAFYDFYDEENDPTWVPYLGLGIGYGHVNNRTTFSVPYLFDAGLEFKVTHTQSAPIGQGIIGISYYYSDYLSFGLDYRYVTTNTIKELNSRISTNTLNFNFNYWFADS